ncbi:hypothetical protein N9164_02730 [Draconibacterium sp.]|nr:hypothetical protein [Draconibacterium sp.]
MNRVLKFTVALVLFGLFSSFLNINPGKKEKRSNKNKDLVPAKITDKFYPVSIKDIKLEGEIEFPMEFRFIKGRKRNSGRVALMRGPVIYGLNLDKNPEATANGKRAYNDLRRILLDPETIGEPESDDSVRPGGTAVRIKAWRENYSGKLDRKHEFTLKLTEFPDPGSQFIYFKIPDYSIEVDDELVNKTSEVLLSN